MSLVLFVAVLASGATAQVVEGSAAVLSHAPTLESFGVTAGTRQILELPEAVTEDLALPMILDGQIVTLSLRPHSVRSPGFQLLVAGADGVPKPRPAPPGAIVRGTVEEWPGSVVTGSLRAGRLQALVLPGSSGMVDGGYAVEPLDDGTPGAHLVHRASDMSESELFCGVDDAYASSMGGTILSGSLGKVPAMTCDVAADTDVQFYTKKGSSVDAVIDHIETVLAGCSALYEQDFGIDLAIITIVVRTEEPDPFTTNDGSTLLDQLGDHWANDPLYDPDLIQLFSGRNIPDIAGIATLGGVCDDTENVSLVEGLAYQSLVYRVRLSSHEFGHNFGANHCQSDPDCGIMCPGLCGPASSFGTKSTQSILKTKLTVPCLHLDEKLEMPVIASTAPASFPTAATSGYFTLNGSGLTSVVAVQVADQLQYGLKVFVLNDTTLHVAAPLAKALGPVPVRVFTAAGRSNVGEFVYGPNEPPILNAPWSAYPGGSLEWVYGGDAGDIAVLLVSTSNATKLVNGLDVLTNATVAAAGPLNAAALGRHEWPSVPVSLAGLALYSQIVMFDEDGFDDASVVRTTNVQP
jgi:hypothetical protein